MKKLILLGLAAAISISAMGATRKKTASKNRLSAKTLELNLIHINDHHSHLEEEKMDLVLNGKKVTVNVGGMPRMIQRITDLKKSSKNNLVLHAGDALSGTLYYTLFKGKADAALMNVGHFDLFTLGNHEFDDGNTVLKNFLDELKIPVVSANVIPDKGSILEGKWTPYVIKKIDGQDVVIVGLDVVGKTIESSSPGKDIKFHDEVETAKKMVAELQAKGINKIIFLSHAGYEKNLEIAEKVSGIDVIITGDTHYLLGESYKEYGLKPVAEYPKKIMSPAGEPVYVAEAWCYSHMVGNMKIKFNDKGVVTELKAEPTIVIGDNLFEVKNDKGEKSQLQGKEKEDIIKYVNSRKDIKFVKEDPAAQKVLARYKAEKNELGKKEIGNITQEIPGGSANRIPNDKNPEGSLATTLVSETVLHTLKNMGTGNIDMVILNSGGVRISLTPGKISYDDAYTLLPFTSNTIYILKMNGAEIKQVIEDSLNFALDGGSSGAFPYGAGIRFEATREGTLGTRVKKIEVLDAKTNKWVPIDAKKTYTVGTNSYIAAGKDGYTTFGKITSTPGREGTNTHLGVETSFINYVKEKKTVGRPESSNVKFKY
ncbi:NAD nucleotidase [Leptotrichia trevisanii]|uniref:NAD pyrophosphatase/5'-nucleotidase NadN n=1 Tax=Leptotrichia trevisanii TaxID=109328 RepID=A0A510JYL9_9FUSO|nr:NAD nucleotidase [Leptotrichia trevisanii]BBM44304.1 NAD pyrophosphatase/5'-nucleotidase NadN [Leptotrichia trevisanii]